MKTLQDFYENIDRIKEIQRIDNKAKQQKNLTTTSKPEDKAAPTKVVKPKSAINPGVTEPKMGDGSPKPKAPVKTLETQRREADAAGKAVAAQAKAEKKAEINKKEREAAVAAEKKVQQKVKANPDAGARLGGYGEKMKVGAQNRPSIIKKPKKKLPITKTDTSIPKETEKSKPTGSSKPMNTGSGKPQSRPAGPTTTSAEKEAIKAKKQRKAQDRIEKRKGGYMGGIKSAMGGDLTMRTKNAKNKVERKEIEKQNRKNRGEFAKKKTQQAGAVVGYAAKKATRGGDSTSAGASTGNAEGQGKLQSYGKI